MIAHTFSCHFIADHTDDSADNTDIKIRIVEFIALFDMIFQITFILADISLCSFNFLGLQSNFANFSGYPGRSGSIIPVTQRLPKVPPRILDSSILNPKFPMDDAVYGLRPLNELQLPLHRSHRACHHKHRP